MKKISTVLSAVVLATGLMYTTSCSPSGDKNSTDTANSNGEGAVDSTKMPGNGKHSATDTSHQFNSVKMHGDTAMKVSDTTRRTR